MSVDKTSMLEGMEAIIFDMDGTLIDSMWIWEDVDHYFYKTYRLEEPEGFKEMMEGMSFREVAELYLKTFPTLEFTPEELQNMWTSMAYERYTTEVELKEGLLSFLKEQREKGIKLGIATSNGHELVSATLNALGVTELFDSIHTAGEVAEGKPSPDIYLLVADDLKVDPSRCLVFEDVPMGIMAGKNAGMTVCAIYDKYSDHQDEKKRELADFYINDYNDVY